LCWQAVAKCEESMDHNCEQALAHQKAARQFFSEFKKIESSGLISPYNENLQVRYLHMSSLLIDYTFIHNIFNTLGWAK